MLRSGLVLLPAVALAYSNGLALTPPMGWNSVSCCQSLQLLPSAFLLTSLLAPLDHALLPGGSGIALAPG